MRARSLLLSPMPTTLTVTSTPCARSARTAASGSPLQDSRPSDTTTTTRGPVTPARSSATASIAFASGVWTDFSSAIPSMVDAIASGSSGPSGTASSVSQDLDA